MARNESKDELYEAKLAPILNQQADEIIAACVAGDPVETGEMIESLGEHLGDSSKLAEVIRAELQGRTAFRSLLRGLARDAGAKKAEAELVKKGQYNREISIDDRIFRYLDSITA
jgi:hypothetical protein